MMKKLSAILVSAVLLIPAAALAQPETLVGGRIESGGYGGPVVKFTQVGSDFGLLMGGQGGWVVGKTFTIGGGGYGLVTTHLVNDGTDDYEIGLGYGGVLLEYLKQPDDLIHIYASCLFAIGGVSFREPGGVVDLDPAETDDLIYVLEPSVSVCLNVTEHFRIAAGLEYRFFTGLDQESIDLGLKEEDLTGPSFLISFRFGVY
jgi:hypothetical protein